MSTRRRVRWGALVTAPVLALGTIALIWFVAVPVGPVVCPAIYPMPTNCAAEFREGSALVATVIVAAILLFTVLVALWHGRLGTILTGLGIAALALAPVVTYMSVAWSPGFPIR